MNKRRSHTGTVSLIFAAALILTVMIFLGMGFISSPARFAVSFIAVLVAEIIVYFFVLYWLKTAGSIRETSPVLLSGAFIVAGYLAAVLISALVLDGLLQLPVSWYAAEQLILLLLCAVLLGAFRLYGKHAGGQERKIADASRSHRLHMNELVEIRELAGRWKFPESERLTELISLLEERFRYSNPLSKPGLSATEDIISQQISLLHDQVSLLIVLKVPPAGWEAEIHELTDSIAHTLQRRNRELAELQ
ncbi:hypothetical protein [Paenibacillus sp. PK3_47]|uniref:hypothetical protein n=1 Tax=Paenibacillus sp. PK3_47 TaxID=2072642 RepID=UPI00201DCDC5|nr:hypothetical protein [Paenibacillus sp. PK3_47]